MPAKPPKLLTAACCGNEFTPQRHWQPQALPAVSVPWPATTVAVEPAAAPVPVPAAAATVTVDGAAAAAASTDWMGARARLADLVLFLLMALFT